MQRVVIVGGGFAGLWAALGAARARADAGADIAIELISRDPLLVLRPRLYEQAPDRLTVELPPILAAADIQFTRGEVGAAAADHVVLADGRQVGFDRLVLAAGSVAVPPPIDGFATHGLMLDTLADAERLRAHLAAQPAGATVVVIGAGFTGLEIATELAGRHHVVLLDRAAEIGDSLGSGPRPAILAALERLGVDARAATEVRQVTADGVRLSDGSRIETRTLIWAGGLAASPLTRAIDAPRDASSRLLVDRQLGVPGHPRLLAAGDVASALAAPDHRTLLSCQHAGPLGRVAGHNAVRGLVGLELATFSAPAYVTCLDLGGAGAMLSIGWDRRPVRTGADAKVIKRMINGVLIVPPKPDRAALLAAAGLDTGRPVTEAGIQAFFEQLIERQPPVTA